MKEFTEQRVKQWSQIIYDSFKSIREKQQLDPKNLAKFKEEEVKVLYPQKADQQLHKMRKYYCCEACCGESPGSFCCCTSNAPDGPFKKMGLGICLYFKYIKHSTLFYIFMSLFAILSCVVCFAVAIQNDFTPLADYQTFFFATTYGTFSAQKIKCQYSLIKTNQASFTIGCPHGTISLFGSVFSDQSLNSLYNCRNQQKKIQTSNEQYSTSNYILTQTNSGCLNGTNPCTVDIIFNGLPRPYDMVSYSYHCIDNSYTIGKFSAQSRFFLYFVVAIDIFFCLCYFVFVCSQLSAQSKEQDYFKKYQISLNDFSLQIKGFKRGSYQSQFKDLLTHANSQLAKQFSNSVVQYTFPEDEQMLDLYQQQTNVYEQMYQLINDFYFRDQQNLIPFNDCHNIVISQSSKDDIQSYRRKLYVLVQKYLFIRKDGEKQMHLSSDKISLYLVFKSIPFKQRMHGLLRNKCCGKKIQIGERQYQLEEPPIPDMIQWQNHSSWTCLRVIISWILTLVICAGSYLLFGFIQYEQNKLFQNYNYGIDCQVLYTSAELQIFDATLNTQSSNYLTCICKNKSLLSSYDDNYCSNWTKQKILYMAVPLLISLGIVIYNIIVSFIFKILSRFQRHFLVVDQQISFTLKRAFILIMNMGLIMILLNINYKNSIAVQQISFLFLGKYDDLSPDWYINIGTIIILTMIFNIAFPIIELTLACLLKCLKRCWDQRCCTVVTSKTTKKGYIALYSDDIFIISERYAYLIAILIVSLTFSGVIPILTPIAAISFFLLYYSDKVLMFKFFQNPINYNHTLHKLIPKAIVIGLVSHFALTAFFLSQSNMIADNSTISSSGYNVNSGSSRIDSIVKTSYILPYVAIFCLLMIVILIRSLIISLFDKIYDFCKGKLFQANSMIKQELIFWNCLSKMQIQHLLDLTNINIKNQELRRTERVNSMIQSVLGNTAQKMQENLEMQETIMKNTREMLIRQQRLQNRQNQREERPKLLGQPSYDYLNKTEAKEKKDHMLELQRRLREVRHNWQNNDKSRASLKVNQSAQKLQPNSAAPINTNSI